MYNDEYDHFNQVQPAGDNDALRAALKEHDTAKQRGRNQTNRSNHSSKPVPPPKPPPLPYKGLSNGKLTASNGSMNGINRDIYSVSNNLNKVSQPKHTSSKNKPKIENRHTYDNEAYTGDIQEPYVTRNVGGMQTTDI